jgi:hypothetical protein
VSSTTIAALLRERQEALQALDEKLQRRQARIVRKALARQDAVLQNSEMGLWGAATRQRTLLLLGHGTRSMVREQVEELGVGLYDAVELGQMHTAGWLTTLDQAFLGDVRPFAWTSRAWADAVAEEVLESRLRAFRGSFERYGTKVIGAVEKALAKLQVGAPWSEVRETVAKATAAETKGRAWMVERIVRTEASAAYNGSTWRALLAEDHPERPMLKKLVAVFDLATGQDSIMLDGQIRPVREMFFDGYHGFHYMHPPNRPNDREIVVGWRGAWGDDRKARGERAKRRIARVEPTPPQPPAEPEYPGLELPAATAAPTAKKTAKKVSKRKVSKRVTKKVPARPRKAATKKTTKRATTAAAKRKKAAAAAKKRAAAAKKRAAAAKRRAAAAKKRAAARKKAAKARAKKVTKRKTAKKRTARKVAKKTTKRKVVKRAAKKTAKVATRAPAIRKAPVAKPPLEVKPTPAPVVRGQTVAVEQLRVGDSVHVAGVPVRVVSSREGGSTVALELGLADGRTIKAVTFKGRPIAVEDGRGIAERFDAFGKDVAGFIISGSDQDALAGALVEHGMANAKPLTASPFKAQKKVKMAGVTLRVREGAGTDVMLGELGWLNNNLAFASKLHGVVDFSQKSGDPGVLADAGVTAGYVPPLDTDYPQNHIFATGLAANGDRRMVRATGSVIRVKADPKVIGSMVVQAKHQVAEYERTGGPTWLGVGRSKDMVKAVQARRTSTGAKAVEQDEEIAKAFVRNVIRHEYGHTISSQLRIRAIHDRDPMARAMRAKYAQLTAAATREEAASLSTYAASDAVPKEHWEEFWAESTAATLAGDEHLVPARFRGFFRLVTMPKAKATRARKS